MHRNTFGAGAFCACLVLAACGHGKVASRAPVHEPVSRATQPPQATAASSPPPRGDDVPIELYMLEHFQIITWARDAIINSELDALRTPLRALADHNYRDVAPGAWMAGIGRIQQTARLTAEASTLSQAAAGVAAMARLCGDCHRQSSAELEHGKLAPFKAAAGPESLTTRMQHHGWAADRMWEGLVLPSDGAWSSGASALANTSVETPSADPPVSAEISAALVALRELGAQAVLAEDWDSRTDAYGRLLVACATCHRKTDDANDALRR